VEEIRSEIVRSRELSACPLPGGRRWGAHSQVGEEAKVRRPARPPPRRSQRSAVHAD